MKTIFTDWGLTPYRDAWQKQQDYFYAQVHRKQQKLNMGENVIIFCEHPHVYTLGHSGNEENMLMYPDQLEKIHAEFVRIDRGGDITYHGPGQLVCYPILDLESFNLSIRNYINKLEEIVINVCNFYKIKTTRLEGCTGVWIDAKGTKARKICAIGVRSSRYITMHGLAFNINTDLNYFSFINPCGFVDKGVTSLQKELGQKVSMSEVKKIMRQEFIKVFELDV
ncbi:MAG: lipoyl(octanoyl) transferase LipB [Bacteroidaceae bacterium]